MFYFFLPVSAYVAEEFAGSCQLNLSFPKVHFRVAPNISISFETSVHVESFGLRNELTEFLPICGNDTVLMITGKSDGRQEVTTGIFFAADNTTFIDFGSSPNDEIHVWFYRNPAMTKFRLGHTGMRLMRVDSTKVVLQLFNSNKLDIFGRVRRNTLYSVSYKKLRKYHQMRRKMTGSIQRFLQDLDLISCNFAFFP